MADTIIPNGGTTDDQTPELRIVTNAPLWGGAAIHIMRNGVDVGTATAVSPTEFKFTDNVADGSYVYTAELRFNNNAEDSQPYAINVVTPTPALPIPTITVFETVPVVNLFNTSCPVPNPNTGQYFINVGIDSTAPTGDYGIYDENHVLLDLDGVDTISHVEGTATLVALDSNTITDSFNFIGRTLTLVRLDPNFVPSPPPAETFFTDTVSSSPGTDAVYPSPLVATVSIPITGPNIHWGTGQPTTILVEVTNVGSQAYVVGCSATGVNAPQDYQSIAAGQTHMFNVLCYGNPGDMVGAWININSIVVGNANFYMETQQTQAVQPYIPELPGTVIATTVVANCNTNPPV